MITSSEQIISAAMTHTIDTEDASRALEMAMRVEREITCPVTGVVMDSRTAFGIFDSGSGDCMGVISPEACGHDNVERLLSERESLFLSNAADVWAYIS